MEHAFTQPGRFLEDIKQIKKTQILSLLNSRSNPKIQSKGDMLLRAARNPISGSMPYFNNAAALSEKYTKVVMGRKRNEIFLYVAV
jgi:hypothetical protein